MHVKLNTMKTPITGLTQIHSLAIHSHVPCPVVASNYKILNTY